MNKRQKVRRDLLKILGSIPVGLAVGCSPKEPDAFNARSVGTGDAAVGVLAKSVGHWTEKEATQAAAFTDRLIASPGGQFYLGEGASLVTGIAQKLGATSASSSIDLTAFSGDEKEVLLRFIQQFYSYLEIRNQLCGEPVFGECQADPLYYTRLT